MTSTSLRLFYYSLVLSCCFYYKSLIPSLEDDSTQKMLKLHLISNLSIFVATILTERNTLFIKEYIKSNWQKQRIEIARALFFNRSVILADEATASLDPLLSKTIHDTLKKYNGTLIEVAHHLTAEEKTIFNKIIDFRNNN